MNTTISFCSHWINVKKIFPVLIILLTPWAAFATAPQWSILPAESSITFTAIQNNAPVSGEFKKFSGNIQFDPEQLDSSQVDIIIDMNSITSSYGEVADTLKTPDWFSTKQFPQGIFKAHEFKKTGNNTFQANGELTIRDKTAPVTLTFVLEEYNAQKLRAIGTTTLKRSVFGVGQGEWAKSDVVKDEVQIKFVINALIKD